MTDLGDRAAQGRVFGNLGNTYYLLGDFQQAVNYHLQVVCVPALISRCLLVSWSNQTSQLHDFVQVISAVD